ncbi:MAG: cache domain-containing protein [Candidatus Thiodiazotropha sp. 6PLUC9]
MSSIKPLFLLLTGSLIGLLFVGVIGFNSIKETLIESKKEDIATVLNVARHQSAKFINQYHQGILSKEQTDDKIIEFLSGMRYESNYVWANDNNAIARVHVREEVIGQFQKSYARYIDELTDDNFLYDTDTNIKPGIDKKVMKINGMAKIPEWEWIVGYGIYMDDFNQTLYELVKVFIFSVAISIFVVIAVAIASIKRIQSE